MSDCQHHFILPPPSGPTVIGRCKHCGDEREHLTHEEQGFTGRSPKKPKRNYNGWVTKKAKEDGE